MGKQVDVGVELAALGRGRVSAEALPLIRAQIEAMEKVVEARVFEAIASGTLTPEAAVLAWQEKGAYRTLLRRLTTQVRVGQSASNALTPHMGPKEQENG